LSALDRILESPAFPVFTCVWLAGWVVASIVFRLQRGKPIIPRLPDNALFKERAASGRSLKNFLTFIGGASSCLMVAVTDDELIVTPFFPFNLMFLPEIYGLEVRVPRSNVHIANPTAGLFGGKVVLSIDGEYPHEFSLRLRNRNAFLAAMSSFPRPRT